MASAIDHYWVFVAVSACYTQGGAPETTFPFSFFFIMIFPFGSMLNPFAQQCIIIHVSETVKQDAASALMSSLFWQNVCLCVESPRGVLACTAAAPVCSCSAVAKSHRSLVFTQLSIITPELTSVITLW